MNTIFTNNRGLELLGLGLCALAGPALAGPADVAPPASVQSAPNLQDQARLQAAQKAIAQLEADKKALQSRQAQLEKDLGDAKAKAAQGRPEDQAQLQAALKAKEQVEGDKLALQRRQAQLEKDLADAKARAEADIQALLRRLAQAEKEAADARQAAQQAKNQLKQIESDLVKAKAMPNNSTPEQVAALRYAQDAVVKLQAENLTLERRVEKADKDVAEVRNALQRFQGTGEKNPNPPAADAASSSVGGDGSRGNAAENTLSSLKVTLRSGSDPKNQLYLAEGIWKDGYIPSPDSRYWVVAKDGGGNTWPQPAGQIFSRLCERTAKGFSCSRLAVDAEVTIYPISFYVLEFNFMALNEFGNRKKENLYFINEKYFPGVIRISNVCNATISQVFCE